MSVSLLSVLGLGFALGMLHCLEADHLAAIATVLAGPRRRLRGARVGLVWGLGHAATVMAVGAAVVATGSALRQGWATGFEFAVGLVLVGLGGWRIVQSLQGAHLHEHRHPEAPAGSHRHIHLHRPGGSRHGGAGAPVHRHSHLPFWIGLLHGLAGSAGAMIAVPPLVLGEPLAVLGFLALFGLGTTVAMALMAHAMARGLTRLAEGRGRWLRLAAGLAGALSVVIGAAWSWRAAAAWA